MNWTTLLFTCLLATGGIIASTYEAFARANILPVGTVFHLNGVMTKIGVVVMLGAAILSAFINPWWTMFIVLFSAWLFSPIVMRIFGGISQLIAPALIVVGGILLAIYL